MEPGLIGLWNCDGGYCVWPELWGYEPMAVELYGCMSELQAEAPINKRAGLWRLWGAMELWSYGLWGCGL
jgi:hypothetical protein